MIKDERQGQLSVPGDWLNRILFVVICLCCICMMFFSAVLTVCSQESQSLLVQPPSIENFPLLSVQFNPPSTVDVDGAQLERDQIQVFENEEQVEILSLDQTHIGVHFTLVINGSTFFDLNDENGVSPYDRIQEVLEDWVSTRDFTKADSWNLITNEDVRIRNTSSGEVWRMSLINYEPNFRNITPDLEGLSTAIENARDRVVPFGVDKSILYISTPPTAAQIETVNALTLEAQLAGIQVNVWMVGDAFFLTNDQGGALINLAQNTGGSFFSYTGTEPLPNPGSTLSSLGTFYTLSYKTGIRETGSYPLRVQINTTEGEIGGESIPFYIEVEPPKPILLEPPETIERRIEKTAGSSDPDIYPDLVTINILIEFPDGHIRDITTSRLVVDGRVVQVKDQAPFDVLTWDISSLNESGTHILQVEVSDNLGLSGQTIETPVQIIIIEPVPEEQSLLDRPWVIAVIVGLSVLIAFGTFWLLRRAWFRERMKIFQRVILRQSGNLDQSDQLNVTPIDRSEAMFQPLSFGKSLNLSGRITIPKSKNIIGSNPEVADLLLQDPKIAGEQAQLQYDQGRYWLKNLDEIRGTWINYQLLKDDLVEIKSGDVIHFGDAGFRFTIITEEQTPEVSVSKYKPSV